MTEYLDTLKPTGLRALVQIPRPINSAELKQFIHTFKDRSEIWAWSLADEPPGNDNVFPHVARSDYEVIKREDPTRPVAIVFAHNGEPWLYREAMDVYMIDHYLVFDNNEFEGTAPGSSLRLVNTEYFGFLCDMQLHAVGKQAYWIVLQASEQFGSRLPTMGELRYLKYASIQARAKWPLLLQI